MTCAIIRPELRPLSAVRNGGSPLTSALSRRSLRRSLIVARCVTAIASMSAASATGAPWKLPPETMSPSASAKTIGLSVAAFISIASVRSTKAQGLARRAVHLRRAAHAIGVLHAAAVGMRAVDRAVGDQRRQSRRRVPLAVERPAVVDARVERLGRAAQRLDRHGRGDVGGVGQPARVVGGERQHRRRRLRAVDERQAFLGLELHRLQGRRSRASRRRASPPSPISTSARWASGARSPLAPTDPREGMRGCTPRVEQRRAAARASRAGCRSSPSRARWRAAASWRAPRRAAAARRRRRRGSAPGSPADRRAPRAAMRTSESEPKPGVHAIGRLIRVGARARPPRAPRAPAPRRPARGVDGREVARDGDERVERERGSVRATIMRAYGRPRRASDGRSTRLVPATAPCRPAASAKMVRSAPRRSFCPRDGAEHGVRSTRHEHRGVGRPVGR